MNVILDLYPEGGPMNGIYSALVTTCAPSVFVAACDLPRLEPRDIERLLAHWEPAFPALVYRRAGAWEPLCGIYSRKLIPLLRQRLQNGDYQLQDLLRDAGARGIEYPAKNGEDGLANMNTQEDYRNLLLDEDNNERRENYADAS
jgi:molybdopterin-guanine dinucleotide biosynthesis protein A